MSAITGQFKDVIDKGQGKVADAASVVSAKVSEISDKVRDAGTRAAGTVRDQYDHLEHRAKDAYGRARQTGQQWEQGIEAYVQRKPLESLLIAAGIGLILGFFWKRK